MKNTLKKSERRSLPLFEKRCNLEERSSGRRQFTALVLLQVVALILSAWNIPHHFQPQASMWHIMTLGWNSCLCSILDLLPGRISVSPAADTRDVMNQHSTMGGMHTAPSGNTGIILGCCFCRCTAESFSLGQVTCFHTVPPFHSQISRN